jgi:hypothetical protein
MKRLITISAVCLSAVSLAIAQMQPVVSGADGQGNVDWSARYIEATGIGAPNPDLPQAAQRPAAIRAATMISLRNALETVKGLYLTSSTTVQNFMTTSDLVQTSVNGFVKGFEQQGRTKYMSDGSVEVSVRIPLDGIGGLSDKLYGSDVAEKPSVTAWEGKQSKKSKVFTGLIIDCKGLKIKPALSARVLDEQGKEIYGSAYVSREWAVKYGIVGYAKDLQAAAKIERVGGNPGSIKALKASGDNSTDVVIADKDAADVRSAAENLKFLSECRVVFVLD